MKILATAGELASQLDLATAALDPKIKIDAFCAVRLRAQGSDRVELTMNAPDRTVTVTTRIEIQEPGETAVRAAALAGVVGGFPAKAAITLMADERGLEVTSGQSHYKLQQIVDLPEPLQLQEELGHVELDRKVALKLFGTPLFAAAQEDDPRIYLTGLFLQRIKDDLIAVATDGTRLVRVTVPATDSLSTDRTLILSAKSAKLFARLLKHSKTTKVSLRRSKSLIEIKTDKFTVVSQLLAGAFPVYERILPGLPLRNCATVHRAEFAAALTRVKAVVDPTVKVLPAVSLAWNAPTDDSLQLSLLRQLGAAHERIAAQLQGRCQIALSLNQLVELVTALDARQVCVSVNGEGIAVVTDPTDPALLALQMPLRWNFASHEADAA